MIGNKEKDFEKVKIHMGYCIFILVLLVIVLFTMIGHDNKELASQIAFGATLSGIILSILAIILTLIGEAKSDNTKDNLLNISKNLENIVVDVQDVIKKFEEVKESNKKFVEAAEKHKNFFNSNFNNDSVKEDKKDMKSLGCYLDVYKRFEQKLPNNFDMFILIFYYSQILCHQKGIISKSLEKGFDLLEEFECNIGTPQFTVVYGSYAVFKPIIESGENKLNDYIIKKILEKYPEAKKVVDSNI
ncbi:TPA: hypothetical protein OLY49_001548 [Clostridioides difficile]|uniref:hypothetical protein n=1 Tax=Clostridioides difficile TaxID=1496 RepID=UPI000DED4468|nr:hypothetical protein [Clostridioides difficile]HCQ5684145.1 hypothetical protein [Clostridioides difficile]